MRASAISRSILLTSHLLSPLPCIRNKTENNWGPNAVFRFPQEGGTGAIWKKVAALLPAEKQQYDTKVTGIDAPNKTVSLSDGTQIQYNKVRFKLCSWLRGYVLLILEYFALHITPL